MLWPYCRKLSSTDSIALLAARNKQPGILSEVASTRTAQVGAPVGRSRSDLPVDAQRTHTTQRSEHLSQSRATHHAFDSRREPRAEALETKQQVQPQLGMQSGKARPWQATSRTAQDVSSFQARSVKSQVQLEPPAKFNWFNEVKALQQQQSELQVAARAARRQPQPVQVELPVERIESISEPAVLSLRSSSALQTEAELRPDTPEQQQSSQSVLALQTAISLRSDVERADASEEQQEQLLADKERAAHVEKLARLLPGVFVVDTVEEAERVCALLMSQDKQRVYACDTEVAFIDVKQQSPCGHGKVICLSIYGGDDIHLGAHPPDGCPQDTLWLDCYCNGEDEAKAAAILDTFKPFLEAPDIQKVWHNYSFDRHVLANMGVHCQGFAGDTMHMARLNDSSRKGTKNYSLASLTGDAKLMDGVFNPDDRGKLTMKELFGKKNITKNGQEGKLISVPPVEELQSDTSSREKWINYSALDAKSTHQLHTVLKANLQRTGCIMDPAIKEALGIDGSLNQWDIYERFWQPFGELLTDMEKEGMLVNREHLAAAEKRALEDQKDAQTRFRDWAKERVPDAAYMNVASGPQIRQLLFAGIPNNSTAKNETLELSRTFKAPNVDNVIEEGKKVPKKNIDITLYGLWGKGRETLLQAEVYTPSGWPAVSTPVLRSLAGKPGAAKSELARIAGLAGDKGQEPSISDMVTFTEGEGEEEIAPEDLPPTDWQSIHASQQQNGTCVQPPDDVLEYAKKAGLGKFYAAFENGEATPDCPSKSGLAACAAIDALCEVGAIDTLLSNFIVPLQEEHIATKNPDNTLGRIHCSLNINTETGRLSARRPNLQNQPALEKDRYKVRQAFTADISKGNTLVVADYGQLELRLLAHMTNCKSMLDAFLAGGDFHSRTALGMYDHIQEAIQQGDCLLEWDGPPGSKSPVPLLKDRFGSERRKAKVLNFSIAYGKTAHGLSKDWKVDLSEAQETVARWYSDRPEVKRWQQEQQKWAEEYGYVRTMLGRRRTLPDARSPRGTARGHAMRAAINTPIQGSAADVATAAMLTINGCAELRELGWRLLLQVHDEVILEGPKESADRAKALVVQHMGHPFNGQNSLRVALSVDANTADTWYEAK